MKQKIFFLTTLLYALSLGAIELEINLGTGINYVDAKGKLVYKKEFWTDSYGDIDHGASSGFYYWMEVKPLAKYWPKFRFETTMTNTEGSSLIHISATDEINSLISAIEDNLYVNINDTQYPSRLNMNTYEVFAFYEYFENMPGYPTFAIGAGTKTFDFDYNVVIIDGLAFGDNGGDTVPMLYFKSRYSLDDGKEYVTQLATQVEGKYYLFGDSTIYEYLVKVDVMAAYNKTTDIGLEMGYKVSYFDIKGDDIAKVGGDMKNSSIFFGLVGHFR